MLPIPNLFFSVPVCLLFPVSFCLFEYKTGILLCFSKRKATLEPSEEKKTSLKCQTECSDGKKHFAEFQTEASDGKKTTCEIPADSSADNKTICAVLDDGRLGIKQIAECQTTVILAQIS